MHTVGGTSSFLYNSRRYQHLLSHTAEETSIFDYVLQEISASLDTAGYISVFLFILQE
jgi:hypothetical protein